MTDSSVIQSPYPDSCRPIKPDWKPEDVKFDFGNIDDYEICARIGRGRYSTVFSGLRADASPCAIKVLKPVRFNKINKEITILQQLRDGPNLPKLFDIVYDPESQSISLVMELIENVDFRLQYADFTPDDVRVYLYKILRAMEFAHSKGIIHRDIKPQNIMIDHRTKQLRVIDWGLADYYTPGNSYQVRVATRHYKAPELLLSYQYYSKSVDIWGVGVTFATMLFRRYPIFRGRDNAEILMKIVNVFGGEALEEYIRKYSIQPPAGFLPKIQGVAAKGWSGIAKETVVPDEAMDLLKRMVVIDHETRITAEEALRHPYLNGVREMVEVLGAAPEV